MYPFCGNPSIPPRAFMESLLEEQDNFFPISSQNAGTGFLNDYVVRKFQGAISTPVSVIENVKLLVDLGLNRSQIHQLCQNDYMNALNLLADTDEGELDQAVLRLQQRQSGPRQHSLRFSEVPSLISDRSSLRASGATDFSISMQNYSFGGSDCLEETTAPESSQPRLPEMHCTRAGYPGSTFGISNTEEDLCYQDSDVRIFAPLTLCSRTQNIETGSYAIPDQLALPDHQGPSEQNLQVLAGEHAFLRKPQQASNRCQKPTFPCSELGCSSTFSSDIEFSKHLTGDHDKDVTFTCIHPNCPKHPFETCRIGIWKRHHTTHHRSCLGYETCKEERRDRGPRKYWGCGLCEKLNTDVKSFAKHHRNHFFDGRHQQKDVDFSTIMRSLLRQGATNDKWSGRNVGRQDLDGTVLLSWEPETSADLREALEYGTFQGLNIEEPDVVDRLLKEVFGRARRHRKRSASSPPIPEDSQPVSSLSFRRRLLSSDKHHQLRAGIISGLEQVGSCDAFDAGL